MEPLLTEMYNLSSRKGAANHSVLDRREMVPGLSWARQGSCKALYGDASCQKQQQQQLLEVGVCEDPLAHRGPCAEQRRLEVETRLQQEDNRQSSPLQDGELLVQNKRLDAGNWRLDIDEEDDKEIYWGCFYFFPWLRTWRREKREQL